MSDSPDVSRRAAVSEAVDARMRTYGFEPGEPIHASETKLSLAEAQRSLFESTYDTPIPVYLGDDRAVRLPVVITKAEVHYEPHQVVLGETPKGCYRYPSWVFEGWLVPSGYGPDTSFVRVRIVGKSELSMPDIDEIYWQRIPDNPDPAGRLVWADD